LHVVENRLVKVSEVRNIGCYVYICVASVGAAADALTIICSGVRCERRSPENRGWQLWHIFAVNQYWLSFVVEHSVAAVAVNDMQCATL